MAKDDEAPKEQFNVKLIVSVRDAFDAEADRLRLSRAAFVVAGAMALSLFGESERKRLADIARAVDKRKLAWESWRSKTTFGQALTFDDAAVDNALRELARRSGAGQAVESQSKKRGGRSGGA